MTAWVIRNELGKDIYAIEYWLVAMWVTRAHAQGN